MKHLTLCPCIRRSGVLLALGLAALRPTMAAAQVPVDSVPIWTRTVQVGPSLAARDAALSKLASLRPTSLPAETQRVLIEELNRVHQVMKTGGTVSDPDQNSEAFAEYYDTLVMVVSAFETREAALALLPAVAVSAGVSASVVMQLGDTVVSLLVQQLGSTTEDDDHIAVLQTLGYAWFWADSLRSPMSDRSRALLTAALTSATGSGSVPDMLGVDLALLVIGDPAFLPLAQQLHDVAATAGYFGQPVERGTRGSTIPGLAALAASRSTTSLATGLARIVTAVCGNDAAGRRNGACQSIANDVAAASTHLSSGRTTPARNGFESVGKKIDKAYADGAFSDAEHALLAGNVAMVLRRLAP